MACTQQLHTSDMIETVRKGLSVKRPECCPGSLHSQRGHPVCLQGFEFPFFFCCFHTCTVVMLYTPVAPRSVLCGLGLCRVKVPKKPTEWDRAVGMPCTAGFLISDCSWHPQPRTSCATSSTYGNDFQTLPPSRLLICAAARTALGCS